MSTELLHAITAGATHHVIAFIEGGGDARACDAQGLPLLRWCAHYGDVTALAYLLRHGAQTQDLGENLDLIGAVFHGHEQLVGWCLAHGADPSYRMPATGETPLHAALCRANRPVQAKIVARLLAAGANVHATTIPGATLDSFMRDVRALGETALHRAAAYADAATIDRLLAAGADREQRDVGGNTPLTWASWHLRPDAILRKLCFGEHRIHQDRRGTYDHGLGWMHSELEGS